MKETNAVSAAQLAYLGDAVLEVLVRRYLVESGSARPSEDALGFVTAQAQSDALEKILPHLTEEEENAYRRGRNSVHANVPKHATVAQYRRATGFEALFGYLELSGAAERMAQLFREAYNINIPGVQCAGEEETYGSEGNSERDRADDHR